MGRVLFAGAQRLQDSLPQRRQWWRRSISVNLKRTIQAIVSINQRKAVGNTTFLPVIVRERDAEAPSKCFLKRRGVALGRGREMADRARESGNSAPPALGPCHPLHPSNSGSKQASHDFLSVNGCYLVKHTTCHIETGLSHCLPGSTYPPFSFPPAPSFKPKVDQVLLRQGNNHVSKLGSLSITKHASLLLVVGDPPRRLPSPSHGPSRPICPRFSLSPSLPPASFLSSSCSCPPCCCSVTGPSPKGIAYPAAAAADVPEEVLELNARRFANLAAM